MADCDSVNYSKENPIASSLSQEVTEDIRPTDATAILNTFDVAASTGENQNADVSTCDSKCKTDTAVTTELTVTTNHHIEDPTEQTQSNLPNAAVFADAMAEALTSKLNDTQKMKNAQLEELLRHQGILLESLEHENEKFASSNCVQRMEDMMAKCKVYYSKILAIKKSMEDISRRTSKVKRQCLKLQELKSKSKMEAEEAKRKEINREKLLMAQPATNPLQPTT